MIEGTRYCYSLERGFLHKMYWYRCVRAIGSDINSAHTYTCKVYSSSVMDPGFKVMLQENDVGVPILRVLELDGVISERKYFTF